MPARNIIKAYTPNTCYHLYNRGVEKKPICCDDQDFSVLRSYIQTYLEPKNEAVLLEIISNPLSPYREKEKAQKLLRLNNFTDCIELYCYCLMPNHFHMLIRQTEKTSIDAFMNSLWTRYTMYFNRKYKRVGPLFQSVYKAVQVQTDDQLLHLSRYIHRNPIAKRHFRNPASKGEVLRGYIYGSYQEYLGIRYSSWIKPLPILEYFASNQQQSYADFVESYDTSEETFAILSPVIIET